MSASKPAGRAKTMVASTLAVLVVGAIAFQGIEQATNGNPTASVTNGAPRGLLALAMLLEAQRIHVVTRDAFDAPYPAGAVLLIPPPERAAWHDDEVATVRALVADGTLRGVVITCDDDGFRNALLEPWLRALDVECRPAGSGDAAEARGTLPAYRGRLTVSGVGRAHALHPLAASVAWVDDEHAAALRILSAGAPVTLLGSATVLANDGLAAGDNATAVLTLLASDDAHGTRTVVIDEAHHQARSDVLLRAMHGTGPLTAACALALLFVFSLWGLVPRRGDGPTPAHDDDHTLSAEAQTAALAALYRRARAPRRP